MVIRGKPRGNGSALAGYLTKQGENDRTEILDIYGTSQPHDLRKSLIEMSLTAELTKSDKGLYHAQINPAYGEDKRMSKANWLKACELLGRELKLNRQKRVIVLHEKNGRTHAHVVWERYDHSKGCMISDSYSRLAQDRARQEMEKIFEHKRTPTRNAKRDDLKQELTQLWNSCPSGQEFIKLIERRGYALASGAQRPFIFVDDTGRSFDLVRQLDRIKTKNVKTKLQGIKLAHEKQVIKQQRQKHSERSFENSQEKMLDKIVVFKEKQAIKQEKEKKIQTLREDFANQREIVTKRKDKERER